jgi:RimJ/RimL family protein N-acetyltransferase
MMSPDEIAKDSRRLKAPLQIDTPRLRLSRPTARDAEAVFERYASDPDVTQFVGWPLQHRASWRVLEKCGFVRDLTWSRQAEFPNLASGLLQNVLRYVVVLHSSTPEPWD